MSQPITYVIEGMGLLLVLAWIFKDPQAFNRVTTALSSQTVTNVRILQGR